jgi:hypothetical protein
MTLILFSLLLTTDAGARAEGGIECVRAQCEGKGRTCVETLHVTYEACRKAANKKCNTVQLAEKFNCLKAELTPCALARNDQQTACLEEVRSCHAACGPFADGKAHYWCVGEFDTLATAAFCAADPAAPSLMDDCGTTMNVEGQMLGALTCDPL